MSHSWNSLEYRVCQLEATVERLQGQLRRLEQEREDDYQSILHWEDDV